MHGVIMKYIVKIFVYLFNCHLFGVTVNNVEYREPKDKR